MLRFSPKMKKPTGETLPVGVTPLGKRFRLAIFLITATILTGIFGFKWINKTSWVDALYLTVVTLSTVGYGDVVARGEQGHLFTTVFIFLGIGSASYSAAVLMGGLVDGDIQRSLKRHRIMKNIRSYNQHVILCGFGRVGASVADRLVAERVDFVVIETDSSRRQEAEVRGYAVLGGDATRDETLRSAGIERARSLITTLPDDSDNLFIVLSARQLNPDLRIVARAIEESTASKMIKAGADNVARPAYLGAHHLTQAAIRPAVLEFLQFSHDATGQLFQVEEMPVVEKSSIAGHTLLEANFRATANVIVLGIKRSSGELVFNPSARTTIEGGDTLVVVGHPRELDHLREKLQAV